MCADSLIHIPPLREKVLFFQSFSEDIEISRLQRTCVELILVKVGEKVVLSHFVRDNRLMRNITAVCGVYFYGFYPRSVLYLHCSACAVFRAALASYRRIVIMRCAGLVRLDVTERCVAHGVRASYKSVTGEPYACEKVLFGYLGRPELEVVRAACEEYRVIFTAEDINYFSEPFTASPKLVAKRHHYKRRMMRKLFYNAYSFAYKILLFFLVVALFAFCGYRTPERKLRLHIYTKLICRCECRIGRTAGMKTVVIYAVTLCCFQSVLPRFYITRSKARQRPDKTVVLSSEEAFTAVYKQFSAFACKRNETEL